MKMMEIKTIPETKTVLRIGGTLVIFIAKLSKSSPEKACSVCLFSHNYQLFRRKTVYPTFHGIRLIRTEGVPLG